MKPFRFSKIMLASTQPKSTSGLPPGEAFTFTNGFNSPSKTQTIQPAQKPKPSDNEVLEHKHTEGEKISRVLRFTSDSRLVQGLADRIFACAQRENFFLAEDLHSTDTGELFDGRGSLWACNSRICPTCVGRLSKRSRAISRHVFETEKLFLGERWFFLTFTMPDLALRELPLLLCRSVIFEAWRKFSRSVWFGRVIRGGMKSEEFTVGSFQQYHYHIHSLAICKNRITSNDFVEIRREWTKALRFAFKKHNVKFECNTKDGLANVNVLRVYNKQRAILELCKYITKSESWAKIPPEQLAEIATVNRFPRMFEVFGACKETAKTFLLNRRKKLLTGSLNAQNEVVNNNELLTDDAYLDKKKITVRNSDFRFQYTHAPPKKRQSWRVRCRILPRLEWIKSLEEDIDRCREYRMKQLRHKYAFATFRTLSGEEF